VDNRGDVTLTQCVITENAPAGVWNRGEATRATLVDSTIEANEHWGVFNRDGDLTVTGCTFKHNGGPGLSSDNENRRPTVTIMGCDFEGNRGSQGGGVFNSGGEMRISDSNFRGNGGGTEGGAISAFGTLFLERCQIQGNTARATGGGVTVHGTATISDCDISGNHADGQGGGIDFSGGALGGSALTVTNSTIVDNSTDTEPFGNASEGGGVYVGVGSATFIGCTISGNDSGDYGGGVYNSQLGEVQFENCRIRNNSVKGDYAGSPNARGGGIYNLGSMTFRSGEMSEVTDNTAYSGGGIYHERGTSTIARCEIAGNNAVGAGGGITIENGTVAFVADSGSSVTNNTAGSHGGGIAIAGDATVTLNDTVVSDNSPDNCSAGSPIPGCTG
jgi:hypothetical protein